ncbi:MAG: hypothetical protein SWO11_13510 [Thermodesulfobacteriota bacterium]|nr:hypothetical protein [Thermodesulfobacteriota bacterium]
MDRNQAKPLFVCLKSEVSKTESLVNKGPYWQKGTSDIQASRHGIAFRKNVYDMRLGAPGGDWVDINPVQGHYRS